MLKSVLETARKDKDYDKITLATELAQGAGHGASRSLGDVTGRCHGVWLARSMVLFALENNEDIIVSLDELLRQAIVAEIRYCDELIAAKKAWGKQK